MMTLAAWQRLLRQGQRIVGLLARPMTLGVRVIALDAENRVFLVRHTYAPGFHLPGGGVETGETALAALERELAEEGCLALGDPPLLLGFFHNPRHSRRDHVALYVARNVRQTRFRAPDWEIAECGFFPVETLPEAATPSTRARIAEFLRAAPQNPVW